MNPREFQILASRLVSGMAPADLRTAISRAYYAAYNLAVEVMEDLGLSIGRSSTAHVDVQRRLSNCDDIEVQRAASQLANLHSRRIEADYRLDNLSVENQKTAQTLVNNAERILEILEECRNEPQRRQRITTAILSYDRKISSRP